VKRHEMTARIEGSAAVTFLLLLMACVTTPAVRGEEADHLQLRAENLTLLPQSKPVLQVHVANARDLPVKATVSVNVPPSWRLRENAQEVRLNAGSQQRLSFPVMGGDENRTNRYDVEIVAQWQEKRVTSKQTISVTSAPYFKPTIDGDPSEWKDAIPVTFVHDKKRTTIATYWNRRRFSLLVSVEEAKHVRCGSARHHDAVQLALAARDTTTSRNENDESTRFEYLVYADGEGTARCCQLLRPGMKLAEARRPRPLDKLMDQQAEVAVRRDGDVTHYEIGLSFAPIRQHIRPSEGREFFLSVLVHDPDGAGVRDWGVAAGLWESQRNRLAWCDWNGAKWGVVPPQDCRTAWGMCSSRY